VSGEIGSGEPPRPAATARVEPQTPPARPAATGGGDPKKRLAAATAALNAGDAKAALGLLPELAEEDLLALLPALHELGSRIVPDLLTLLESPRRELRQAAAILLGMARDRRAIDPLTALLGQETSAVWNDAARALGNFGPRVVGPLCALLRGAPADRRDALSLRVGRALAELVLSDGDAPGGAGRLAVENLLEVADPAVSSAARRALGTLADVRGEGRGGGGADDREIRAFSSRALEAITAPELDVDGAIEVVGDD
jgi:HEAT repeat protein